MTDQSIETELSRKAIGDAAYPNVSVTREFLQRVLAHIQKPHVCPHCQEREAFNVTAQIQQSEARGCVKREFARRVERGML